MTKPFPETVRDLWVLLDGPNMLNLSFDSVLNAVKQMKKSVKARLHSSVPGNFKVSIFDCKNFLQRPKSINMHYAHRLPLKKYLTL